MSSITPEVSALSIIEVDAVTGQGGLVTGGSMDVDTVGDDSLLLGLFSQGEDAAYSQVTGGNVTSVSDFGKLSDIPWVDMEDSDTDLVEGLPQADVVEQATPVPEQIPSAPSTETATQSWVGGAAPQQAKQKIKCFFCQAEHLRTSGDVATKKELCPCVRFLNSTWDSLFAFTHGAIGKRGDVSARPRIYFYGQMDRKRDPLVIIRKDESPMFAWLRFELHMLKHKYSNVDGQPSRLLWGNLHQLGLGTFTQEWAKSLFVAVKASYDTITAHDDAALIDMACTLAMRGFKVWHSRRELLPAPVVYPVHRSMIDIAQACDNAHRIADCTLGSKRDSGTWHKPAPSDNTTARDAPPKSKPPKSKAKAKAKGKPYAKPASASGRSTGGAL